jgi:hypothetical protein
VVKKLETSLIDDARVIIYDHHMFVSKARTYLKEAPFRWSILRLANGLTRKHYTRLKKLATLAYYKLKNYVHKTFYDFELWPK